MFLLIIAALIRLSIVVGVLYLLFVIHAGVKSLDQRLSRMEDALLALTRPQTASASPASQKMDSEIETLLRQNLRIEAIDLYRKQTGVALRDAKDAVDAIERRMA